MFNSSLLGFFIWKACMFSCFHWFLCWKSGNCSQQFFLKIFWRSIYLQLLVIDVVFVHYTEPKEWSVWFMYYPCFFFFIYFLLLLVFSLTNTNKVQRMAGMGEGINVFLVFHSLMNLHLVHQDFYYFFLINPFVITRLMTSETFSPYRFAFYFYFHWCN